MVREVARCARRARRATAARDRRLRRSVDVPAARRPRRPRSRPAPARRGESEIQTDRNDRMAPPRREPRLSGGSKLNRRLLDAERRDRINMVIPEERTSAAIRVTVLKTVQRVGSVADVIRRDDELNEATSRGDAQTAGSFYAEDFVLNGPANRFQNRAETLAVIGRTASSPEAFRYASYDRRVEAACVTDEF